MHFLTRAGVFGLGTFLYFLVDVVSLLVSTNSLAWKDLFLNRAIIVLSGTLLIWYFMLQKSLLETHFL